MKIHFLAVGFMWLAALLDLFHGDLLVSIKSLIALIFCIMWAMEFDRRVE